MAEPWDVIHQVEYRWHNVNDFSLFASTLPEQESDALAGQVRTWVRHPRAAGLAESACYKLLDPPEVAALAWRYRDSRAAERPDGTPGRPLVTRMLVGLTKWLTPEVAISLCLNGLPDTASPWQEAGRYELPVLDPEPLTALAADSAAEFDARAAHATGLTEVVAAALSNRDRPLAIYLPEDLMTRPLTSSVQGVLLWGLRRMLPERAKAGRGWSFSTFELPLGAQGTRALPDIVFRQALAAPLPGGMRRSEVKVHPLATDALADVLPQDERTARELVAAYRSAVSDFAGSGPADDRGSEVSPERDPGPPDHHERPAALDHHEETETSERAAPDLLGDEYQQHDGDAGEWQEKEDDAAAGWLAPPPPAADPAAGGSRPSSADVAGLPPELGDPHLTDAPAGQAEEPERQRAEETPLPASDWFAPASRQEDDPVPGQPADPQASGWGQPDDREDPASSETGTQESLSDYGVLPGQEPTVSGYPTEYSAVSGRDEQPETIGTALRKMRQVNDPSALAASLSFIVWHRRDAAPPERQAARRILAEDGWYESIAANTGVSLPAEDLARIFRIVVMKDLDKKDVEERIRKWAESGQPPLLAGLLIAARQVSPKNRDTYLPRRKKDPFDLVRQFMLEALADRCAEDLGITGAWKPDRL